MTRSLWAVTLTSFGDGAAEAARGARDEPERDLAGRQTGLERGAEAKPLAAERTT